MSEKRVIITGATGMVGGCALRICLENPDVSLVTVMGRSRTGINNTRLREVVVEDFTDYSALEDTLENQDVTSSADKNSSIKVDSQGRKYIVDPSKIQSGGPPKDGIPSIDNPKFVSVSEADRWIQDNELVLAINYRGIKRVYPFQILVWHEIVNDTISGDPILVTYCPLCGSGIAYRRELDGEAVEFGTTGRLYNSNLVMYDRKTDTWWTQIDGKAIVGELTGQELTEVSIDTVTWREWKVVHPDSEVLNQDTGFSRPYGRDPYGTYYADSLLMFPVENEDRRIHPKTVIFGIEADGLYKAYREEDVIRKGTFEDSVAGLRIQVTRDAAGVVTFRDLDSGREIVKERDFWFAWYAFHPDTLVYEG